MPRLRKKCSLAPTKRTASAMSADDASAVISEGSSSRRSISEPARLRLWPSSPIWSIWAMIALMSIGPCRADRLLQDRAEHAVHPAQPVDHLGAVGAVAQHLAEALVERAPRRVAVHLVAQLVDPHRRADDAGHRADGVAVVARLEGDRRRGELALGLLGGVGQPLEEHRADERALHRARGAVPLERRAGVQEGARARGRAPRRRAGRRRARRRPAVIRRSAAALASLAAGVGQDPGRSASVPSIGGCQSASVTGTAWSRRASASRRDARRWRRDGSLESSPCRGVVECVMAGPPGGRGGGQQGQGVAGGLGVGEEHRRPGGLQGRGAGGRGPAGRPPRR